MNARARPFPRRHALLALAVVAALAGVGGLVLAAYTTLAWTGAREGLFLLRGSGETPFELADDLLAGQSSRLLAGHAVAPRETRANAPRLAVEWNAAAGNGVVVNHAGDGTRTETYFSRFVGVDGAASHGLFVGGAPAQVAARDDAASNNRSGMTLHENGRWHHLWCNVNEAIASPETGDFIYPQHWRYLGSRVVASTDWHVELGSTHEVEVDGAPLHVERRAVFVAGQRWFHLLTRIVNRGRESAAFAYVYGDDPWVGKYGSAEGNTGWLAEGLVHSETAVDGRGRSFAGMVDTITGLAVFLGWRANPPDFAYFANEPRPVLDGPPRRLAGNSRFVGLQWMPRSLAPGAAEEIALAVGWARADPATGVPPAPKGAPSPLARVLPP